MIVLISEQIERALFNLTLFYSQNTNKCAVYFKQNLKSTCSFSTCLSFKGQTNDRLVQLVKL